jgi:hypothetical protein
VSEFIDAGHDQAELDHQQYGSEQEHDAALHELHEAQAHEHDVHFQHGHHEELDTPNTHYSETDFTNYSEHDAEASTLDAVDAREHDESENYAERLFAEQEHDHLHELETEHELPGIEGHELGGHELQHDTSHQVHGHEGHIGKAEHDNQWVNN